MWNPTKLTTRLHLSCPIIQAPMAGASSHPSLTAAVSNAGALGSYGAGYLPAEKVRKVIRAIRCQTDRCFNLNLFIPSLIKDETSKIKSSLKAMEPYFQELDIEPMEAASYAPSFDDQIRVVIEEKVPVFSFTFGIPEEKWLAELKANGIVVMGTATHLQEALELERRGVDFIVGQGTEAGGHRGTFLGKEEEALIPTHELMQGSEFILLQFFCVFNTNCKVNVRVERSCEDPIDCFWRDYGWESHSSSLRGWRSVRCANGNSIFNSQGMSHSLGL